MALLNTVFQMFREASLPQLVGLAVLQNALIVLCSVLLGESLVYLYRARRVSDAPEAITLLEYLLVVSSVLLNSVITVLGVRLWQAGWIHVSFGLGWKVVLDVLVLILALDFLMYVFHRVAHHPVLYLWVHATHHLFDKPRPLTLFALNPVEALGFGVMLLLVCLLYPVSALGLSIYVVLNVVFGLVGHIGVEPLGELWLRSPVLRYVSTSTFHAEHHHDQGHNYGFYTLLWDKWFGTLSPDYALDFRAAGKRTMQGHDL